ncbi:glycoside hydrolase family 2 [Clostridiaceae bacterium]|nr:glycoside hydrolase family 2 [Clostridiaceae bacterium]RKI16480.1 glycoside hydrolase family 2 [bacterium 1XD21-70]
MREEYPRPEFVRKEWMNLNGRWAFEYGNERAEIEVPFVCQSKLSGIGKRIKEDRVAYERRFKVPGEWKDRLVYLHFGAVDYRCSVFVNHRCVGHHTGGQTSFRFDITRYLNWEEESIRVEVVDPLQDESIPRGKQFWEEESKFIWYTPSTGIWQTVWLEPVAKTSLEWIHFTPDIDEGTVKMDYQLSEGSLLPCRVHVKVRLGENEVFHGNMLCNTARNSWTVDIFRKKAMEGAFHFTGNYWSPENPILYDVLVQVDDGVTGKPVDFVESYFGMRKIHVENGKLYLNNQPYYQKLLLDQGYWEDGLVTAPSDRDYQEDIRKSKAMGFNGCRKHEKVEDPRFLYWADKMGFLVWGAMASFWVYTPQAAEAFIKEWMDVIHRDYNHPSIIVWGMLNESWGVPRIYSNQQQQDFSRALYYLAKGLDETRLVISNDGWEMTETDICAFHSYKHGEKGDYEQHAAFKEGLKRIDSLHLVMEKLLFAKGSGYKGQPVVLTECGGITVKKEEAARREDGEWGYTSASEEDFLDEYARVVGAIYDSELLDGFCYTQLTDVEQETNGLLTSGHCYKFDPDEIRKINERKR